MRKSPSFCASRKDYMRRIILDAELTTFRTPRPLDVTSHPLESSHLYQLAQVGYKEARLPVFVLKPTASKSMIESGFLLAIPLSRKDVCSLLFEHFACPLKPAVGRLSVQIVLRRQIAPSDNPWHEESIFSFLSLVFEVPNPMEVTSLPQKKCSPMVWDDSPSG